MRACVEGHSLPRLSHLAICLLLAPMGCPALAWSTGSSWVPGAVGTEFSQIHPGAEPMLGAMGRRRLWGAGVRGTAFAS